MRQAPGPRPRPPALPAAAQVLRTRGRIIALQRATRRNPDPTTGGTVRCMSATTEDLITVPNAEGHRLAGILTKPSSTSQPAPVIILCHGYASHKDDCILPQLAAAAASAGLATCRFDFAGNGDSQGTFQFANYWEEVEDIRAVKLHLEQAHGLRVLGLLGHSKGGNAVLLYASKYDDIPLVVNLAARLHMAEGIRKRWGEDVFEQLARAPKTIRVRRNDGHAFDAQLRLEDLQARTALDMQGACKGIQRTLVLTVHGTDDETIPVEDGRQIADLIPDGKIVEIPGANHNFRPQAAADAAVAAILEFLRDDRALADGPA